MGKKETWYNKQKQTETKVTDIILTPEEAISKAKEKAIDEIKKNLSKDELPLTENLIDTIKRVIEYWNSDIKNNIINGKRVIIVAHGNSLRGLIKYLDDLSDEEIMNLELETGNPICYELDDNLKPIKHYYLK